MAYEWINFNELAYSVNGGEFISLAPYVSGGLGTLTSTFISNPDEARSYNASPRQSADYAMIASCQSSSFNLYDIFSQYPTGSYIEILNPRAGRSTCFRMTINKNTYQLNCEVRVFGAVTAVNQISYDTVADSEICLSFLYDPDTNDGKVAAWYRGSYSDWLGDHRILRQTGKGGSAASGLVYTLYSGNQPGPGPSPDDPYGDDDYDSSTGGDGGHDDTSDTISQDAIPIAAATRTGMCTAYVPNWGEIRDVASALLDPNIFQILAQNVVKFSDVIIGLSVFPCTVPASYTGVVKGNIVGIEIGTGVVSHIADDQYVEINCGDLTVQEYWGNCLDYNPYTKISIFLPFCGTYELDADEVMGKTLNVSYRIDIMSGACLATIKIDGSVFYQYSGQCSAQVPLSSVSFDQFLSSMINLGVATATGVGAIGAAGAGVKEAETAFQAAGSSGSGGTALMEAREHLSSVKTQSANSIADATVGAVMGSKGFYTHAGAMSGSPGFLGVRTPYLTIKRPEQLIPSMYGKFHGYPCNTTAVLGDLTGYTEVGDIRLNIPDATVEEILECEQLLKGGVVI